MYTESMKRKVAKVAPLRLSPNEEASILKQERERRRKLRLQQVREQEKFIAQQIRQDVKERRDHQLQHLAEELRAEWEEAQAEKLRALEEVYLSALNAIGEGHRQAKENEPDLKEIERIQALNKEKAEQRHRLALLELKQHKQKEHKDQTWHIKARRKALEIEKERAAKVASLPPPPPDPLENLEVVKRPPLVKLCNVDSFSVSHYHLPEAYVDREMDTEQPDARTAAVEEAKRLDSLQKEEERERQEQMEKAALRGSYALKMVHLTEDRDRLMKDLEQMQQEDLAHRRKIVSQMPPQLFEPAYRRAEIKEDWQRELESAFEDMYTKGTKMRGDMVLHLKPQPLPDPTIASIDEDLDLSVEPEATSEMGPVSEEHQEAREPPSRLVLRRLLNRIRTQKDQWSAKSDAETASDTLESGSLPMENAAHKAMELEDNKPDAKEDVTGNTVLAGNSILLHPQEQAARIRLETERRKEMEGLERQKMEQLELLRRLEEERQALEEEYYRVQQQMHITGRGEIEQDSSVTEEEEEDKPMAPETEPAEPSVSEAHESAENLHIQMIREYQQRLVEQNRLHKESVDEARKRLQEYQLLLKKRYPHLSISHQRTPDRSMDSPKPQAVEYPPSSPPPPPPPVNVIKSPLRSDSLKNPVTIKSNSEQHCDPNIPHTSRALEPEQMSPRNGSALQSPVLAGPKLPGDFFPQGGVDSNRLADNIRSLGGASSSHSDFGDERSLQESLPQTHFPYQSPHQDDRFTHAEAVFEKQSSISSPGDYDTSSSTTYHPLPSELSLGLPQIDLPEPAIPLQAPRLRVMENQPLGDFSNVREFRERLLSSTVEIRAQQDHLKAMQDQLDKQRDSLLTKQKSQEDHLLQKQKQLEEQMKRHQESLENVLGTREPGQNKLPTDFSQIPKTDRYHFMSTLLEALDDSSQEDLRLNLGYDFSSVLIKPPGREQRWRPSKPPVTKTKLGPFLEQHELSAIMEVETPTSGRLSSSGLAKSHVTLTGQSDARAEEVNGCPDNSHRDLDVSGLSITSMDQSGNESSKQSRGKLSWREMLTLEASHDPSTTDNPRSPAAPGFPAGDGTEPFRNHSATQWAATLGNATHGRSPDGISDYLSTTTISTGSFLTSEKTDSSPVNSDAQSELQRCDYSVIGEPRDGSSSPSAARMVIQSDMRWRDYLTPVENRSHIQQIIDKYTKDLHVSLERSLSFHTPEAVLDTSPFYPLDPKPDFDVSTPSSYVHSHPANQGSHDASSQEHGLQSNLLSSLHNSADLRSSESMSLSRSSSRCLAEAADSSGSFLPLHPENTVNEVNVSNQNRTPYRTLAKAPDSVNTDAPDASLFSHLRPFAQSSIPVHAGPHYTSATLTGQSVAEDSGSFHELMATKTTTNDSEFSEHPNSYILDKNNSGTVRFEELPLVYKELESEKDSGTAGHFSPDYTKQENVLPSQGTTSARDTALNSSDQTQGSESLSLGSHCGSSINFLPSTIGSSAGSLPSFGYTWDSGSARGILEEPDLTLLSLNDSSIVCSEPTITQNSVSAPQEERNYSQHSFKLLPAEVDASGVTLPDQSSLGGSLSQHFAEIGLEFTSTPGSLQEAFLKRKKHFIEKSSKRIQEIKIKDRVPTISPLKSQPKDNPVSQVEEQNSFDTSQGEGGQLKKVVEVRVSTPEGRKLSEIEMHQRTVRLYNRLDEVKTRKEEKIRQEAYARNREKAKEFKKRTLEKLRANKMK